MARMPPLLPPLLFMMPPLACLLEWFGSPCHRVPPWSMKPSGGWGGGRRSSPASIIQCSGARAIACQVPPDALKQISYEAVAGARSRPLVSSCVTVLRDCIKRAAEPTCLALAVWTVLELLMPERGAYPRCEQIAQHRGLHRIFCAHGADNIVSSCRRSIFRFQ